MASLSVKALSKRYGAVSVLHDVDIEVADGEFVVLVGPSGCGKSTLLRMIAGLDDISSGELWIGDRLANTLPPQRRDVSMVFQSYALFPHMNVRRNIDFGPRVRGEPAASVPGKVAKAAATLTLSALLDRLPRQLSGGQRQRVAMGRAIVRDPDVFLFDEPLSNLDSKLRVQMRTEIKALHQALKTTIVYVTHDQIEAMTLADRIVVMNAGRVEQIGSPLELYDRPVNRFVAGFLGSPAMSLIPARLERTPAGLAARAADGLVVAVGPRAGEDGRPVEIGVRPEDFRRVDAGAGLPMIVQVVEPTGAETHVHGALGGAAARCVFHERVPVAPGETIWLTVDPARVHVFDAIGGQRL